MLYLLGFNYFVSKSVNFKTSVEHRIKTANMETCYCCMWMLQTDWQTYEIHKIIHHTQMMHRHSSAGKQWNSQKSKCWQWLSSTASERVENKLDKQLGRLWTWHTMCVCGGEGVRTAKGPQRGRDSFLESKSIFGWTRINPLCFVPAHVHVHQSIHSDKTIIKCKSSCEIHSNKQWSQN